MKTKRSVHITLTLILVWYFFFFFLLLRFFSFSSSSSPSHPRSAYFKAKKNEQRHANCIISFSLLSSSFSFILNPLSLSLSLPFLSSLFTPPLMARLTHWKKAASQAHSIPLRLVLGKMADWAFRLSTTVSLDALSLLPIFYSCEHAFHFFFDVSN